MRADPIAKTIAALLALAAHGALALAIAVPTDTGGAGGTGDVAEVRLGAGFQDLSAGTLPPSAPSEADQPVPPAARATPPVAMAAPVNTSATPSQAVPAQTLTAAPIPVAAPTLASSPPPAEMAEVVEAPAPRSPRPQIRPAVTRQAAAASRAGSSETDARAGQMTGTQQGRATQTGDGGAPDTAGTTADSRFRDQVMRRLASTAKPQVSAPGAAMVTFTLSASGAISAIRITRGSGSTALDRAAVQLVQSAAPFPRPPKGADRIFSVEIRGS